MSNDAELLRRYAEAGTEEAFTELVRRHVDFVYTAALRQTRNPHRAEDVTQIVFTDLARKAASLSYRDELVGWLHTSTRYAAIKVVRCEARRERREQEAQMNEALLRDAEPSVDWEKLRPVLDEALGELNERDRMAILLRFFKDCTFAEVGTAARLTEEAARKRVERALDKLHGWLSRRGVTSTTAALATVLANQATAAAPIGLAASVAGTALAGAATIGATVAVASALQAGKTLFMTLTQKSVVVVVVLTAITGAVYEHQVIGRQQEKIASLEQQAATDQRQFRQMLAQRDEARARAEQAEHLVEAAVAAQANDALTANLRAVKMRVERLKQRISQSPDQQIPEMRFLKEDDWVRAALNQELQTDEDYRKAMSAVRTSAKNYFAQMLQQSLRNYMKTSQGNTPSDVLLLAPYFTTPVDYMMLQRYEIQDKPDRVHNVAGIRDKETSIVDDTYDSNVFIGVDDSIGWNSGNNGTKLSFIRAVQEAMAAYRIVNEGKTPKDPAEILPYFKNPTDGQKFMEQSKQSQGLP